MNIIDAIKDPKVFGPFFKGNTWDVWFVFLAALFALPLTPEQLELYTKYTGRKVAPAHPHFAMRRVGDPAQIFSVFHELFAKGGVRA